MHISLQTLAKRLVPRSRTVESPIPTLVVVRPKAFETLLCLAPSGCCSATSHTDTVVAQVSSP